MHPEDGGNEETRCSMKRYQEAAYHAVLLGPLVAAILALAAVIAVLATSGCTPRPVAWPISSSHSQLTATDYDAAETAFSGGLSPLPYELEAYDCQRLLDKRDNLSALALGLCSATGAGGLATLIPKDATEEERKKWDLGLGISTLALGITCTTLGAVVRNLSARFEERCGTDPAPDPAPVEHPATDEVELAPSPFEGDGDGRSTDPTDPSDGGTP